VERILHARKEGKEWHDFNCYEQLCNSTECGSEKYWKVLAPLLGPDIGKKNMEFFQHEKTSYKKPDGSRGSKWELIRKSGTISEAVHFLENKIFGHNKHESYLQHVFKKELGTKGRSNLRKNIGDKDLIVYSDFSKELQLLQPESIKSEAFGASNKTFPLIPIVIEMTVLPAPAPENVQLKNTQLFFTAPSLLSGGRLQGYEVHLSSVKEIHWVCLAKINVKYLSSEPELPDNIFGDLCGDFFVRVVARNLAGLGETAEILVHLSGRAQFNPATFDSVEDESFNRQSVSFWQELLFLSDHGEIPKDWRSIRAAVLRAVSVVRNQGRVIERIFMVTDTGGENWGTQALAQHSFGIEDFQAIVVWCPTPAGHSGQPSDSCGGTFKRKILNEAAAGNMRGVVNAQQLVSFAQSRLEFSEVDQKRYLAGLTVSRYFYYLSKNDVIADHSAVLKTRCVESFEGVSRFKQAFGTGQPFQLLVRSKLCCCQPCLDRDFDDCELKEYVDSPVTINLRQSQADTLEQTPTALVTSVFVSDDICDLFVEKDSHYALKDATQETGFVILQCRVVSSQTIGGMVLVPVKEESKYVQLQEVEQRTVAREDLIMEVNVTKSKKILKNTLEEILLNTMTLD